VIGFGTGRLLACGPDFPNNILDTGDQGVLVAPVTYFYRELDRLHLAPAGFHAVVATNTYAEQNINLEQTDLLTALRQAGKNNFETAQIATQHLAERIKLQEFNTALNNWSNSTPAEWDSDAQKFARARPTTPPPTFPVVNVVNGLPEEFGDYFDGAIAWSNPLILDKAICREMWERVLELPPAQRHFKSAAAAYMLGKSWAAENPDKAAGYFQQVRALAKRGFKDSAGLAAASLGEEARLDLARKQLASAIGLYLDQLTTGDLTAANSLRFTAARALQDCDAEALRLLAADARAQRVITAYLISCCQTRGLEQNVTAVAWLTAVEAANIRDADSAEEFALAAYQAGEWDLAQRWIDRAPHSPTAQWLQAKLLLRAGKLDEAAAQLARVSRSFPVIIPAAAMQRDEALMNESYQRRNNLSPTSPDKNLPVTLADNLTVARYSYYPGDRDAASQVRGELGGLHLARREYTEALDALLRAGFWMDAAYVAERVLTADELKTYVDENWPAITDAGTNHLDTDENVADEIGELDSRREIRYLLARRLTRLDRGPEATVYYPAEWRAAQTNLLQQLAIGRNESLPAAQRFFALASAAGITRTNGMELIGTELEPDWHIHDGNFESGISAKSRHDELIRASADELSRAAQNDVVPEKRWHYRDQAAALKLEAAKLGWTAAATFPDNSDEAARILCLSGSWLDPKAAAKYYQAILHRCRNTGIGAETARIGDFPKLDENGHVIRRQLNAEDQPVPGKAYVIHAGDTLTQIAASASASGLLVTVADLVQANRNLVPDKIRAGRTIDLPVPDTRQNHLTPPWDSSIYPPTDTSNDTAGNETMAAGEQYVIQSGDSLAKIAQAASVFGAQVSMQDILEANPGLDPTRLRVGQRVLIPIPGK